MKDDLQAIKYENVAFQAQRDVYQAQLQGCQDTITHLRTRYVDYARDPGKDDVIIIVRKHIIIVRLSMISFMTWHIISRRYNGVKGILG